MHLISNYSCQSILERFWTFFKLSALHRSTVRKIDNCPRFFLKNLASCVMPKEREKKEESSISDSTSNIKGHYRAGRTSTVYLEGLPGESIFSLKTKKK